MRPIILLDAGPLVAYLDRTEQYHNWVTHQVKTLPAPFLTCESVVSEGWFLLADVPDGRERLINLLQRKVIITPFHLTEELLSVTTLLEQYRSIDISVADACLIRMSELYTNSVVFTLDSDFHIYRKNKRQAIPVLMP
ncbi:MAG: pilus assembly protein [Bacteroidota bacterium]